MIMAGNRARHVRECRRYGKVTAPARSPFTQSPDATRASRIGGRHGICFTKLLKSVTVDWW